MQPDSRFDSRALSQARALLAPPPSRHQSPMALAAAGAFFTLTALALAVTLVALPNPFAR